MCIKLLMKVAMVIVTMAFSILQLDPSTVTLETLTACGQESTLLSEAEIHEKIINSVKKVYESDLENIAEIKPPRLSPIRMKSNAKVNLQVVGDLRNGRLPVELSLMEGKRVLRRQRLFVKLDFFTKVWALKDDLEAGHKLELSNIHEVKVASRKVTRGQITNPDMAVGARLLRASKANTPLKKSLLRIPRLVRRASIVELIFRKGGIFLVAEGEALGDGKRGDIIKVKNLKSKKIVTGRVIGVNKVDVGH